MSKKHKPLTTQAHLRDVYTSIDRLKNPLQRKFLSAFQDSFQVIGSLSQAGMSFHLHSHYLDVDEDYRDAFEFLQSVIPQKLEDDFLDMAINGVQRSIIAFGEVTGTYRERDWKCTERALERVRPSVKENSPRILASGSTNQEINNVQVTHIDEIKVLFQTAIDEEKVRRGLVPTIEGSTNPDPPAELPQGESGDEEEDLD
jgi:hypothetical protein